jgi:hypothetical protein
MTDILFKQVNYTVGALVDFIGLGQIGLPDIQRPFVWPNIKVRDLFDSMYRGYPVGYLLFWQNAVTPDAKTIGAGQKQKVPVRRFWCRRWPQRSPRSSARNAVVLARS